MTPQLHPEAQAEMAAAAVRYEREWPGLGNDFLDKVESALRRLAADPQRCRLVDERNRKINLQRFPYALVYEVTPDSIHVKAVMHLHRRPG